MRYGIISDIHGNLEALEVAIEALSHEKIDEYLCGGDIVGYGTDPGECVKRTRALSPIIVCGNHDAASSGLIGITSFNEAAQDVVMWTRKNISQDDIAFLKGLNLVYKNDYLTLVHGTLQEPEMFHYMFDERAAYLTFSLMDTPLLFVGHTHVPCIFSYKDNRVSYFYKEKIELSRNEKVIVNVGSIGQPRDGDPKLCYSVYDVDKSSVELKRVPYDVEKTQIKILKAGLSPFLAYRLAKGM